MASALHCLQWRIMRASTEQASMSLFLSSGVGPLMSWNLVPSTGMSGRMLTMYAPRDLTFFTRSGMWSALMSGTMTMLAFTSIPRSAHLRIPSS